jgi:hypothetical protein
MTIELCTANGKESSSRIEGAPPRLPTVGRRASARSIGPDTPLGSPFPCRDGRLAARGSPRGTTEVCVHPSRVRPRTAAFMPEPETTIAAVRCCRHQHARRVHLKDAQGSGGETVAVGAGTHHTAPDHTATAIQRLGRLLRHGRSKLDSVSERCPTIRIMGSVHE